MVKQWRGTYDEKKPKKGQRWEWVWAGRPGYKQFTILSCRHVGTDGDWVAKIQYDGGLVEEIRRLHKEEGKIRRVMIRPPKPRKVI